MDSAFRKHARWQADVCRRLDAPFSALLSELLAERLSPRSGLGRRLDSWPGDPFADGLTLRMLGYLHSKVRDGRAPALAALYPPAPFPAPDALWAAMVPLLKERSCETWLSLAPQTNEVARSGVLMPGFLVIARETGLPLRLFELGCSAGLNLLPDRYSYNLGGLQTGQLNSCVVLKPEWEGPPPPDASLLVSERVGVDLNPLDMANPEERNRLLAYVWPEQPERLQRIATAIAIAATDHPQTVKGDAASFVEQHIALKKGNATTIFHSVAFQYFSADSQSRIATHLENTGAAATPDAPLAWLRYETDDPHDDVFSLRLKMWPGGKDRLLARAHPHGRKIKWLTQ